MEKRKYYSQENLILFYTYYTLTMVRFIKALIINYSDTKIITKELKNIRNKKLFINSKNYIDFSNFSTIEKLIYFLFIRNEDYLLIYFLKIMLNSKKLLKTFLNI
jgi:hypothetical protein